MPAQTFITLDPATGSLKQQTAVTTGTAFSIPSLDTNGQLAANMMPPGIGADFYNAVTSENLSAGNFVNIYNNAGTPTVRKADATDGSKRAHGYVKVAVTSPAAVDVYCDGENSVLSGLTPGSRYFLSASSPGTATTTPPSTSGNLVQYLGTAFSATVLGFRPADGVVLS